MTQGDDTAAKAAAAASAKAKEPAAHKTPKAVIDHQGPPRRPGRFRRFIRSVFSHLVFAGLVAAGVLGYFFHGKILRDVGNTVCADNMLGRYMTKPAGPATSKSPASTRAASTTATPVPAAKAPAKVAPLPPATAKATAKAMAGAGPGAMAPAIAAAKSDAAPEAGKNASRSAATRPAAARPAARLQRPPELSAAGTARAIASRHQPAASKPPAAMPPAAMRPAAAAGGSESGNMQTGTPGRAAPSGKRDATSLAGAWMKVRRAFAEGRPDAAEGYKNLIRTYPDVPDLPGELGNIYYRQGKLRAAAEQYYEAAMRLIRRDQPGRAACLIGVLRRLDPAKAAALSTRTTKPCPRAR